MRHAMTPDRHDRAMETAFLAGFAGAARMIQRAPSLARRSILYDSREARDARVPYDAFDAGAVSGYRAAVGE